MAGIDAGFSSSSGIARGFGSSRAPFGQGIQDLAMSQLLPFPRGEPPIGTGDGKGDLLKVLGGLNFNFANDKFAFSTGRGGAGGRRRRQLDKLLEQALAGLQRNRGTNQVRRVGEGGRDDIVRTDPNQSTARPVRLSTPMSFPGEGRGLNRSFQMSPAMF